MPENSEFFFCHIISLRALEQLLYMILSLVCIDINKYFSIHRLQPWAICGGSGFSVAGEGCSAMVHCVTLTFDPLRDWSRLTAAQQAVTCLYRWLVLTHLLELDVFLFTALCLRIIDTLLAIIDLRCILLHSVWCRNQLRRSNCLGSVSLIFPLLGGEGFIWTVYITGGWNFQITSLVLQDERTKTNTTIRSNLITLIFHFEQNWKRSSGNQDQRWINNTITNTDRASLSNHRISQSIHIIVIVLATCLSRKYKLSSANEKSTCLVSTIPVLFNDALSLYDLAVSDKNAERIRSSITFSQG